MGTGMGMAVVGHGPSVGWRMEVAIVGQGPAMSRRMGPGHPVQVLAPGRGLQLVRPQSRRWWALPPWQEGKKVGGWHLGLGAGVVECWDGIRTEVAKGSGGR